MTHHDKARELVELLLAYDARTATGRLTHRAADIITALAEENRRLREALTHGLSFAESWVDEHGGIDGCEMQDRISLEKILAALAGGRG